MRPRLGQVADRPHQGGGGRGGADQGGAGPASQGLAADDQGDAGRSRRSQPGRSPFYVNTETRPWLPRRDHPRRAARQRLRLRRQQLPLRPRGGRAREAGDRLGRRRADPRLLGRSSPTRCSRRSTAGPRDLAWEALRVEAARSRARFRAGRRLPAPAGRRARDDRPGADLLAKAPTLLVAAGRCGAARGHLRRQRARGRGHWRCSSPARGRSTSACSAIWPAGSPMMHAALAEADGVALDDGRCLGDLIYPHPAFSDDERARHEAALRATEVAQPALGAVSLGVLGILEHFGVRPDAVAGHSFGELTALCAAGRIDARRACAGWRRARGRLMADAGGGRRGGAMLAVMAPLERDRGGAPRRSARPGDRQQERPRPGGPLRARRGDRPRRAGGSTSRGSRRRPLAVSAAFHSRFVAAASGPFAETLGAVAFDPPRRPGLREHDRPPSIPPTPTRRGRCWPTSSPGRSSSSRRSRRCTGRASGPSSKSAPIAS